MKITRISFHFFTGLMDDIKNNKDEIINGLNGVLANFRIANNIPSEAPANLPRILAQSISGMFNVTMTNQSVQIEGVPKAMEDAADDIIMNSMMELVNKIGTFFEDYIDRPFNFCGYTVATKLKRDEIGQNAVDFVTNKLAGFDTQMMIDNSMIRTAYIQKEYYINLTIRNEKDLRVVAPNQYTKPKSVEYKEDFLIVEIYVNDKYGFINDPDYNSEIENALQLVQDVNDFYTNKTMDFIKNGSIDYFC